MNNMYEEEEKIVELEGGEAKEETSKANSRLKEALSWVMTFVIACLLATIPATSSIHCIRIPPNKRLAPFK